MNINEIKTPALDKLLEVQDQMDLCRNFLEYFLKNYSAFEKKRPRESVFADVSGAGDYINVDKLLADFFEIDLPQAEKEREAQGQIALVLLFLFLKAGGIKCFQKSI